MSSAAPVELDFLGLRCREAADHRRGAADQRETTTSSSSSCIRGMRTSAIASIGAQQLRRVIAASASTEPPSAPAPPPPPTMTVFYNGAVATFDAVSQDKAEAIMRMAAEVVGGNSRARGPPADALVRNLAKDMPLTRTRSLQQFLQKRNERRARVAPYHRQSDAATKLFRIKEETA